MIFNCSSQSDDKESYSSDESELGIATAESEKTISNGKYLAARHSKTISSNISNDLALDGQEDHNSLVMNRSTELEYSYSSFGATGQDRYNNSFMQNNNAIVSGSETNRNDSNSRATELKLRRKKKYRRSKKMSASRGFNGDLGSETAGGVMNMDMMIYEGSRLDNDDDHDWCEDSMAVELSSVDSTALNDFRSCGFSMSAQTNGELNSIEVSDSIEMEGSAGGNSSSNLKSSDGSNKLTESVELDSETVRVMRHFPPLAQDQQSYLSHEKNLENNENNFDSVDHQTRDGIQSIAYVNGNETAGSIPGFGEGLSGLSNHQAAYTGDYSNSFKYGGSTASGSSFMALADATRASDWLQQAAVAAASANSGHHGNYQPYVQSVLGSFFCKGK